MMFRLRSPESWAITSRLRFEISIVTDHYTEYSQRGDMEGGGFYHSDSRSILTCFEIQSHKEIVSKTLTLKILLQKFVSYSGSTLAMVKDT